MRFFVHFDRDVTYLPGHEKEQILRALPVNADSAEAARRHAYRVCPGDFEILGVEQVDHFPTPPPITGEMDPPPQVIDVGGVLG